MFNFIFLRLIDEFLDVFQIVIAFHFLWSVTVICGTLVFIQVEIVRHFILNAPGFLTKILKHFIINVIITCLL